MRIDLVLNGRQTAWDIEPNERLLDVLRRYGLLSVKRGCETGDCGACTVLVDDEPVNCCVMLAARARGHRITTMEGLLADPLMQELQRSFIDGGAVQCGYCTPGMLISLYARLMEGGRVDEDTLREALSGNLCRCTGYVKPVRAVLEAWEEQG
jgi:putative selenate reductase molybdopterin-binding subunit